MNTENPLDSLPDLPESNPIDETAGTMDPGEVPHRWKERLRTHFEEWLDSLDSIPEDSDEVTEEKTSSKEPDLYSFYEQLTLLQSEMRRVNRRTAETFSQWNEILTDLNTGFRSWCELQAAKLPANGAREESLPRSYCLSFVELLDRLTRLARAFQSSPSPVWWRRDAEWRRLWANQAQAFHIFLSHFEALLFKEGISRIPAIGKDFDPTVMIAVAIHQDEDHPPQRVLEEISAGYLWRGELLRPAQVIVNKLNQNKELSDG